MASVVVCSQVRNFLNYNRYQHPSNPALKTFNHVTPEASQSLCGCITLYCITFAGVCSHALFRIWPEKMQQHCWVGMKNVHSFFFNDLLLDGLQGICGETQHIQHFRRLEVWKVTLAGALWGRQKSMTEHFHIRYSKTTRFIYDWRKSACIWFVAQTPAVTPPETWQGTSDRSGIGAAAAASWTTEVLRF